MSIYCRLRRFGVSVAEETRLILIVPNSGLFVIISAPDSCLPTPIPLRKRSDISCEVKRNRCHRRIRLARTGPSVDASGGGEVGGSSSESDAAEEAQQRIKIGTQRPGVIAPRMEPRQSGVSHATDRAGLVGEGASATGNQRADIGNIGRTISIVKSACSRHIRRKAIAARRAARSASAGPAGQVQRQAAKAPFRVAEPIDRQGRKAKLARRVSPDLEAELQAGAGRRLAGRLDRHRNRGNCRRGILEAESRHKGCCEFFATMCLSNCPDTIRACSSCTAL